MRQIVYMSLAAVNLTEAMLASLHEGARRENAQSDVTGLLLFDGYRFLQALEGDDASALDTMARIEGDPRHSHIIYVANRTVAARQFGDWSMDYRRFDASCPPDEFLSQVKERVRGVADPSLKATFIGFASLSAR